MEPAPRSALEGRSLLPFVLIGAGGAAGVAVAVGGGSDDNSSTSPLSTDVDADGDGFSSSEDCDDANPDVRPMGTVTFESRGLNDSVCDICSAGGPACPRESPPVSYAHLARFKVTNDSCESVNVSSMSVTMVITGVEGVPGNLHEYVGLELTAPPFLEDTPPNIIPGNGADTLFELRVRNQCFDIPLRQGGRLLSIYRYTVNTSRGTFTFEGSGPKAEYPVETSRTPDGPADRSLRLVIELSVSGATGLIRIGRKTFEINGESTRLLAVPVGTGTVDIEAFLTSPGASGQWKFDFQSSDVFEPGSIATAEGQVVVLGPRSVVFRSSGRPGERLRYSIRIKGRIKGRP